LGQTLITQQKQIKTLKHENPEPGIEPGTSRIQSGSVTTAAPTESIDCSQAI